MADRRMISDLQTSFRKGMNDFAVSAEDFDREQCADIRNGRIDFDGAVAAVGGSTRLNSGNPATGTDTGYGIYQMRSDTGVLTVAIDDLAVKIDSTENISAFGASIGSLDNPGTFNRWAYFTEMTDSSGRYLCIANSGAKIFRVTPAGVLSSLASGPANMRFLAAHNGRLWAAGDGSSILYGSKIDDMTTWSAPDGVSFRIGDGGDAITGLLSVGAELLVFKRSSVSRVDGFGNSDIIVAQGGLGVSGSTGCIAPRTIQKVGDQGCVWLSTRGLEYYAGHGAPIVLLCPGIRDSWSNYFASAVLLVQREKMHVPFGIFYPKRNEYWLAIPGYEEGAFGGNMHWNDRGLIVNLTTRGGARQIWDATENGGVTYADVLLPRSGCIALCDPDGDVLPYENPIFQLSNGLVLLMDYGRYVYTAAGTGPYNGGTPPFYQVDFRVTTRRFNGKNPTLRKRGRIIKVAAASNGTTPTSSTVDVLLSTDGVESEARQIEFPVGGWLLGDPPPPPVTRIARVSGRGSTMTVEVRAVAPMKIASIELQSQPMTSIL